MSTRSFLSLDCRELCKIAAPTSLTFREVKEAKMKIKYIPTVPTPYGAKYNNADRNKKLNRSFHFSVCEPVPYQASKFLQSAEITSRMVRPVGN